MSATIPVNTAGSGWTTARLIIQGSRGRTQQMASGATSCPSSQTIASVAVLPEPTTTYCECRSGNDTSSPTGMTVPESTTNGGGDVAGMFGSR